MGLHKNKKKNHGNVMDGSKQAFFLFHVPDNLTLIPDYFRYLSGPYPLILPTIMYINTSFIVTTINTLLMKGCVYLSRASVNTVKVRVIELGKSRLQRDILG